MTQALYDSGIGSSAGFSARAAGVQGMPPAIVARHGADTIIRYATGPCALGTILAAATPAGLCAILLGDDPVVLIADLHRRFASADIAPADPSFAQTLAAVAALADAPGGGLALPLDVRGSAFQHRVWQALQRIPAGATASYTEIATAIGQPTAARAVAAACAANPAAIAIPCHRVLRVGGALAGYRWGNARKRALLDAERAS